MKASKYNFFYPLEEGRFLAYNSLKNGLAVVDSSLRDAVTGFDEDALESLGAEVRGELRRGGFLVENDFDELRYLSVRRKSEQYASTRLQLTIAPTMACNLACTYCYETPQPGMMTQETCDRIVESVRGRIDAGIQSLMIAWYGGEPLLAMPVIESLSANLIELCSSRKVGYSAHIVTNATLLTKETAERLKSCRVEMAQVTIDGDRSCHDLRRPYRDGRGSFDVILENIKASIGIIPMTIRVNLDRTNAEDALRFYDDLFSQPWFDQKAATIYFGHVQKYTSSCKCADETVLRDEEFCVKQLELAEYMAAKGKGFDHYPTAGGGCGATSESSMVIGPRGELYKCWNNPGVKEYEIGSVFEPLQPSGTLIDYMFEGFENDAECRECKLLPLCMGGCVDVRVRAKRSGEDARNCTKWRYFLEESLRRYYMHHAGKRAESSSAEKINV